MSSHREAPEISKDPVADSTDIYAFVSPDQPDTVTIITNYIPLEDPAGGPNFFEFGDDVLYRINVDNDGDGRPDVALRVPVHDHGHEPEHVPLQHRPDRRRSTAPTSTGARRYSVTEVRKNRAAAQARRQPACAAVQRRASVDAELRGPGERRDPLRRRRHHGLRRAAARRLLRRPRRGVRPRRAAAVPEPAPDPDSRGPGRQRAPRRSTCTRSRSRSRSRASPGTARKPSDPLGTDADDRRVGVGPPAEGARSRQTARTSASVRSSRCRGSATRCSTRSSSRWAARTTGTPTRQTATRTSRQYVAQPELAKLLPVLYPGVFPNLAAFTADRADLLAILLTGIPAGIIPGFQNFTGRRRPTCCGSTWRSRRRARRTPTGSSAATSPASRTAAGCSTTS